MLCDPAERTSEGLPSLGDEEGRSYGQKSQAVRRRRAATNEKKVTLSLFLVVERKEMSGTLGTD